MIIFYYTMDNGYYLKNKYTSHQNKETIDLVFSSKMGVLNEKRCKTMNHTGVAFCIFAFDDFREMDCVIVQKHESMQYIKDIG